MTDLTNVPVRNINDLELAENIPLDASVLDAVKIPVGGLTQFTQGEALSLKQLREVLVAAMPGWVPSTIDDLIDRSDAEVQKMLDKYLNAIKDVSVVLDAIQGQINESHLALELNKKIDIGTLANGAAARAQETANAAYAAAEDAEKAAIAYAEDRVKEAEQTLAQLVLSTEEQINAAKTQAQQLTEQARQDAQALITALDQKFAALNGNINTEISNLNAGLTQETTARQEGLAQITTTLNAYKVVVDDNLAVLFSKNETIVSDAAALATQVNALKSQVALVEGALSLKLDASIIQNYYTKTEAAENATTVAAGEITKYDSQLVIGGVNQLLNSEAERTATSDEYLLYENSTHIKDFYDNNLGKDVTVSFDLKVPVAGTVEVYCSNDTHHTFNAVVTVAASDVNKWVRHVVTVKPVKKAGAEAATRSGLEFYGGYNTGRFPSVRKVQLEAGNKATDWSPSPRDTQASLDANATAIQNTDTEVSRVNNEVVSQGQSLTTLQNNLNNTNGEVAKKADATVVDGVTSRVAATESGLTSVGNRTTALENSVNHATNGLATKASTSALNTTDSNVSALDGTVKGHTSQLTNLAASIQVINGTLSNKLDASVINNYYTKAQSDASADTIAAGKIDQFNASLVIGGANLLTNSNFAKDASLDGWSSNGGGYLKVTDPIHGPVIQTELPNGLTHAWLKLENGVEYTYSALVKPSNDLYPNGNAPLHYWAGKDNQHQNKIHVLSYSPTLIEAGKWTRINIVFKLVDDADSFRPFIFGLSGVLQLAWTKLERGNKATDWSPSVDDVQSSLDANSTAIQNTNVEVNRVDGKTTANANDIVGLTSRIGTVEGQVTSKLDASVIQNYYTKTEAAEKATTAAAGEISKYDASLVIGGSNLLTNSMYLSNTEDTYKGGKIYRQTRTASQNIHDTQDFVVLVRDLDAGDYTLSFDIKSSIDVPAMSSNLSYFYDPNTTTKTVTSQGYTGTNPDGKAEKRVTTSWQRIWITWTQSSATNTKRLIINRIYGIGIDYSVDITNIKFEKGNKATDWTPNSAEVQEQLDATATAIQATNAEVVRVDGRVTTESDRITTLTGRVDTVQNGLALKADVAALNNIYTKSETDDKATTLAAGEVSKYDANLVIGGTNLFSIADSVAGYIAPENGEVVISTASHQSMKTLIPLGSHKSMTYQVWNPAGITNTTNINRIAFFKADGSFLSATNLPGLNGTTYQTTLIQIPDAATHARLGVLAGPVSGDRDEAVKVKFEFGNKPTDWTSSDGDVQSSLNANASAISQTNATVNALEGVVSSHSSSLTSLSNEVVNLNTNTTNISDAVSVLSSKVDSTEDSITNQASNIVKLDVAIKASTASDNLIPNPTFDSAYDQMGYTVVPTANSEVPSNCPYRFVAKLNSRDNVPNIEDIACTAGDVYEISAYVACAQGVHGFNLMVMEKTAKDGVIIGFPSGGGLAPTSVWTKRVWRWTVRDGVTFFKPLLQIDTFDNSTVWYATNWKVTNISAAAKAQTTADATANTLVSTNATVSQQGDQIIANTESIQSAESRLANNEASIQNIQSTYATKDSVGSLAQTALKSVWQNDITKAVSDISVGGVNLLSNTAYLSASNPPQVLGGSGYFLSGLNPIYHAGTSSTGENHFVIDNVYAERYMRIQAAVSNTSTLKPNSTYTFSVKIRGAAKPLGFRIIVRIHGVFTDLPIKMIEYENDVFSTHGYTFTIPSGTTDIIISLQSYSVNLGESFAIQNSSMKLEEGNVVTAWTIAQEEVQTQLSASTTAINTLDTKVGLVDGRVSAQAEQLLVLTSDNDANKNALSVQGQVINGVKASYMVKMETNGVIGGFGMLQESGAMGTVTTAFGVNADTFFIGAPHLNKKPFIHRNDWSEIDGVWVPPGTYIDTALIANATIGNAKIANLDAGKINVGTLSADRIASKSISADKLVVGSGANMYGDQYNLRGTQGWAGNVTSDYDVVVTGNALSLSGRDHIGPVDLDIPIRVGETYVIEVVATRTIGNLSLNAGFWYQKADKQNTPIPYHSVGGLTSTVVYGGWAKYTYHITVSEGGGDIYNRPAYGRLYFMIDQAASGGSTTWKVGDIKVMRAVENALVVNGGITADKLAVNSVTADKIDASVFRSVGADGSSSYISGGTIKAYYPNGNIAFHIGVS